MEAARERGTPTDCGRRETYDTDTERWLRPHASSRMVRMIQMRGFGGPPEITALTPAQLEGLDLRVENVTVEFLGICVACAPVAAANGR